MVALETVELFGGPLHGETFDVPKGHDIIEVAFVSVDMDDIFDSAETEPNTEVRHSGQYTRVSDYGKHPVAFEWIGRLHVG